MRYLVDGDVAPLLLVMLVVAVTRVVWAWVTNHFDVEASLAVATALACGWLSWPYVRGVMRRMGGSSGPW